MTIPVFIGSIQTKSTSDVIDYETHLLLSKDSMKKANAMINFKNDQKDCLKTTVDIIHTQCYIQSYFEASILVWDPKLRPSNSKKYKD